MGGDDESEHTAAVSYVCCNVCEAMFGLLKLYLREGVTHSTGPALDMTGEWKKWDGDTGNEGCRFSI